MRTLSRWFMPNEAVNGDMHGLFPSSAPPWRQPATAQPRSSGRTSGTPSRGCRADTPGASSASGRCSGSGKRAGAAVSGSAGAQRGGPTLHMPQHTVHSSLDTVTLLAWHSMPAALLAHRIVGAGGRGPRATARARRTGVHQMVAADGAVVDDNVPRPQRDGGPLPPSASMPRSAVWPGHRPS